MKLTRKTWGLGLLVVLMAGAAVWGFRWRSKPAEPDSSTTVRTVERRTLETVVEAAGLLEPLRIVEVKSKASGEVLKVEAETGQRVEQGFLLAQIDARDVDNAYAQADADLAAAKVRATTTEAQRQRMESLRASGFVTQQEYETAVDAAASAKAASVRAQTGLRLAADRRGDVIIRAPSGGTLIERNINPGQIIASATANVSGGTTLFKMADLTTMQVRAKVDETDIGQIQPGQTAEVTVEAYPGRRFPGKVAKIEPQAVIEQNVTLFPVLLQLDNKEGLLKPGMNAEIRVEIARKARVLTVPNSALTTPRVAGATATMLGLDPNRVRSLLRPAAEGLDAGMTPVSVTGGGQANGAGADLCAQLRDKVRSQGGIDALSDDDRTALRECRRSSADKPAGASGQARTGVVFVKTAQGAIEPRRVELGMNDWDHTEVVSGVEEGEQVLVLAVMQMKSQQQRMNDRMRQGGMLGPAAGPRR